MWRLTLHRSTLIILSSTLALASTACSSNLANSVSQPVKAQAPAPDRSHNAVVRSKPSEAAKPTVDNFSKATDIATGAVNISQSATSRDDWSLAVNYWQKAIDLLKAVPSSSGKYAAAQQKLAEYQSYLADTKLKAAPVPQHQPCSDTAPEFFSVPIKDRIGRTPVVEVNFNDVQKFDMLFDTGASHSLITRSMAATLRLIPIGASQSQIADGSFVVLPVVKLKSMEMDGRLARDLPVAVASTGMNVGLLGQDFYKGYEVKITDTAIEFRRFKTATKATQSKKSCLRDTKPAFFQVSIKERKHGIPVVEVTLNEKHKFPMLFDTGASHTLLTESMANQMKLQPVGKVAVEIADGSVVALPVAVLKSNRIGNRIKRDVLVSVAPASDIGLLGQDFFEGYDVTIKDKVIEFRRQEEVQ